MCLHRLLCYLPPPPSQSSQLLGLYLLNEMHSLLLPPASFIPHCQATEVSAPWNEPQHADNVVQFLERMKFKPSRSCGFFIVVVLVDAWVDKTFLQAIRNWQILRLPYFLCSVQNCLCILLASEYTVRGDLSLT